MQIERQIKLLFTFLACPMSTKLTAENNGQHEGVLSLWGLKEGTFKRELHKSHTSRDDDDVDW